MKITKAVVAPRVPLATRLSVSTEITEVPTKQSWREKLIKSASALYNRATDIIPTTLSAMSLGKSDSKSKSQISDQVSPSYIYKTNPFPGAQDIDLLNLRCALTPKGHPITTTALSFSFSDDSYLALYQLGVVKYIQESIHSDLIREAICVGVGAGCLPAITLRFGIDSDRVIEEVVRETTALGKSWGPFGRISGVVEMVMKKLVPADEERLSENNLQISLTRLSTLENVRKSRFESKKEVLETVLASMANPFTSSSVGATRYISGDYSKSSKVFDKYTFTVSGKANSANICPSEEFSAKAELEAQSDEAIYRVMADKGYKDAAGWFKKRWDSNVLGNLMKKTYPSSVYLANERVASEAKVKLNNSLLAKIEDTFNILADDDLLPEYVNLII